MPSDFLSVTIAQVIAWVVGSGILLVVTYGLEHLDFIPESAKPIIKSVLIATLTAAVTALAANIPDSWMAMKVIDAIFAIVAMLFSGWGVVKYAEFKALEHIDAVNFMLAEEMDE